MRVISVKEKMLKAIQELPQEVTFEEVMEKLYFLYKIEKGLKQAVSHEDAKQRMKKWLE